MGDENQELERLMRIRDRQISARDPKAQDRRMQQKLTVQRRRMRKKLSLREMIIDVLGNLSYKVWGAIVGAALGVILLIVLTLVVDNPTAPLVGLTATIVLALVGLIFGHSFDWRDEVRDEMKRH
jgi:hypothetical protein